MLVTARIDAAQEIRQRIARPVWKTVARTVADQVDDAAFPAARAFPGENNAGYTKKDTYT